MRAMHCVVATTGGQRAARRGNRIGRPNGAAAVLRNEKRDLLPGAQRLRDMGHFHTHSPRSFCKRPRDFRNQTTSLVIWLTRVNAQSPLPPPRRLDRRNVYLFHGHHCIERALGGGAIRSSNRVHQCDRRDLP